MSYAYKVLKGEKIVAEATTYAEAQAEAKRVGGHVLSPVSERNPSSGAKQRARGTRDLAYLTDAPPTGIDRAMHAWDLERAAKTRKELAKIKKPSQRKMWLDSHKRSLTSAKSIRESGYLPINRQKLEDAVHDHVHGIKPLSIGSLVAGCTVTNIDTRSVTFRDPNYGTSQVSFSTLRKNPAKDANLSRALSFEAKLAKRNPAHQIGSESTQVATTTGSYRKAAEMLAHHGVTGKVLDYGAGLGLGSDAMRTVLQRVDSFEPEARRWQGGVPVTFTDSNRIPLGAYDGVVSLNVLNVLEPELRRYVAQSICDVTAPSGYALIGVRGVRQVMSAKTKQMADEQNAIWIPKTVAGRRVDVYQKGFTPDELLKYMQSVSGPHWKWKIVRGLADVGVQGHRTGVRQNPSAEQVGQVVGKGAHAVGRGLLAGAKALGRFAKSAHAGYKQAKSERAEQTKQAGTDTAPFMTVDPFDEPVKVKQSKGIWQFYYDREWIPFVSAGWEMVAGKIVKKQQRNPAKPRTVKLIGK